MNDIRNHYRAAVKGQTETAAAVALAFDLTRDDPANFKQGYTFENAVLAALDVFDTVAKTDVEQGLREKIFATVQS